MSDRELLPPEIPWVPVSLLRRYATADGDTAEVTMSVSSLLPSARPILDGSNQGCIGSHETRPAAVGPGLGGGALMESLVVGTAAMGRALRPSVLDSRDQGMPMGRPRAQAWVP